MGGVRIASPNDATSFQARPGGAELNCCSVNGPRVLGLVGEWALLAGKPGELFLNYYGAGTLAAALPSGRTLRLTQKTKYPLAGKVKIAVGLDQAETFTLALRVPAWSEQTRVTVNGAEQAAPRPGTYLRLERAWQPGDVVELDLDMRLRAWAHPSGFAAQPWETDWTVYGPIPRRPGEPAPPAPELDPAPEAIESAPASIVANGAAYPGRTLRSAGGRLHIDDKSCPTVIAVTEWQSETEGTLAINFSADFWTQWWVNGREVCSTMQPSGNRVHPASPPSCANTFTAPIRRGRNVVVLRLVGCGLGCIIALEAVAAPGSAGDAAAMPRLTSLYRGPLLLAYDLALNGGADRLRPGFDADRLRLAPAKTERKWLAPQLLLRARNRDGQDVRLCDFASAGLSGALHLTWLPVRFAAPPAGDFTRENPSRTSRIETDKQ